MDIISFCSHFIKVSASVVLCSFYNEEILWKTSNFVAFLGFRDVMWRQYYIIYFNLT
jgi:hypothetical protein